MLADSVDSDQIALEQYDQGLHCLPVSLLNAHNTLIQKHKVNVQAFPLKGNLKNNTILGVFWLGKMHAFFWVHQVHSGHLHFTSKKIPVCDIDYHKSSEYWDR